MKNAHLILICIGLISLFTLSLGDSSTKLTFEKLYKRLQKFEKIKIIAIAGSDNKSILTTVRLAKDNKIADAILVGDKEKTESMAKSMNIDISDFKMIDEKDPVEAARIAVKLVHDHDADVYMKGSAQTRDVLRAILDRKIGLRTAKTLSNVAVFEIENAEKMLFLTDPSVIPYPTLDDKISLIENAVEVANACGITNPKVAALTAVEFVNPKIGATVEAAELMKLNEKGEINSCIVDGPLSLDLAIDYESAKQKNALDRKITGDADILLFPDIHSANFVYKTFTSKFVNSKSATILTGTSAPVILTARADSTEIKYNSILLAAIYAQYHRFEY